MIGNSRIDKAMAEFEKQILATGAYTQCHRYGDGYKVTALNDMWAGYKLRVLQEEAASISVPNVVVELDGGLITRVQSDAPAHIILLDHDIEGGDEENILTVAGTESYVTVVNLVEQSPPGQNGVNPEFIREVVDDIQGETKAAKVQP